MTRITTPFEFESTAAEVIAGIDLSGKRAIATGASSGIGVETARALAGAGAAVTLAVRNVAAGEKTAADISGTTGNDDVRVAALDLADRASIATFVAAWSDPLHLLVNNAGVMAIPTLELTAEGWEMQFATNHLGHFALSLGLHEALAAAGGARVVSLSLSAHQSSPVVFDDLHFAFRAYDPVGAYGQSKTANVLFAVGATARWAGDGITVNAVMPGSISTNLQRHVDVEALERRRAEFPGYRAKTVEQGAATSVLVATSPQLEGIGGRYFEDCNEAVTITHRGEVGPLNGVATYALDAGSADRLWGESLRMLAATA